MDNLITYSVFMLPVVALIGVIAALWNAIKLNEEYRSSEEEAIEKAVARAGNHSIPVNEDDPIKMGERMSKSSFPRRMIADSCIYSEDFHE